LGTPIREALLRRVPTHFCLFACPTDFTASWSQPQSILAASQSSCHSNNASAVDRRRSRAGPGCCGCARSSATSFVALNLLRVAAIPQRERVVSQAKQSFEEMRSQAGAWDRESKPTLLTRTFLSGRATLRTLLSGNGLPATLTAQRINLILDFAS